MSSNAYADWFQEVFGIALASRGNYFTTLIFNTGCISKPFFARPL
jgi:hypothetical protein